MYTRFFGLSEKPFSITPDPHFLFLSERHAEALAHLVYGVTESGGFIQLTGEVGTGKTTLTRCLLDRLPETVDLALVLNPRLSVKEFLATIFDELHIEVPEANATNKELVDSLNTHLLESHAQGRRTVLLVDEAQNLDSEVLEQLRLLTNLETSKEKLLQIILVGQPELRETLARNDLRQLAQRITGRYHLENLSAEETIAYIKHRLTVAGGKEDIFDPAALWEVHRLTKGVPRLINVICDRALLGAYAAETNFVTRKIVKSAAAEVHGNLEVERSNDNRIWTTFAMTASVLMMMGVVGWGIAKLNDNAEGGNDIAANAMTAGETTEVIAKKNNNVQLSMTRSLSLSGRSQEKPVASLKHLLTNPDIDTSTDNAFRQIFGLWQKPAEFGAAAPCGWARRHNLKCEFMVGSTRLISSINRPAILSLVDNQGQLHNAVITSIDTDAVTLLIDGSRYHISKSEISTFWPGEFLILWQPQEGVDSLLVPQTRGDQIAWLRRSLSQIDGMSGENPDSRYFDNSLKERVQRFQRSNQLEADGLAGVQTLISLNTALKIPGTPVLTSGTGGQ